MRVKITGCSQDTYWYKDCIGQTFEVGNPHAYDDIFVVDVDEDNTHKRFIEIRDCKLDIIKKTYIAYRALAGDDYETALRRATLWSKDTGKDYAVYEAIQIVSANKSMSNGVKITKIED